MSLTATDPRPGHAGPPVAGPPRPLALVARLAAALDRPDIRCCQWKGHAKAARWSTGEGDIDLLVDRTAATAFEAALASLSFKRARTPPHLDVPGVTSFVGFDRDSGRLVHVHAHYRLVIGEPWRRHYLLPFERTVLAGARARRFFATPAPACELLLFVLRMTLRHRARDLFTRREPHWLNAARAELDVLADAAGRAATGTLLRRELPLIDAATFERCLDALRPDRPAWQRLRARLAVAWRLRAYGRRPAASALLWRAWSAVSRRAYGKTLESGGAVIALVGTDGAGKSTGARALHTWLSRELRARHAHLGRPPRSATTLVIGAALRAAHALAPADARRPLGRLTAHLELLRFVATARDRYRLFRQVRRLAAGGGIAICERYPLPETRAHAGTSAAQGRALDARGRLAGLLRRWERGYYGAITPPDMVLVLEISPELAVERKTDEPADYVRRRALMMRLVDWSRRDARRVDASQTLPQVLAALRAHVWEAL